MSKKFKLEIVTPTGIFYQDEVDFCKFDAVSGTIGILADHEPMLIANKATIIMVEKDNKKKHAYISEGFVEVTNEKVSAVVDVADWAENINKEAAIRAKREAEEELEDKELDAGRKIELMASIERANAEIKVSNMRE